jgi:hypothetical protein
LLNISPLLKESRELELNVLRLLFGSRGAAIMLFGRKYTRYSAQPSPRSWGHETRDTVTRSRPATRLEQLLVAENTVLVEKDECCLKHTLDDLRLIGKRRIAPRV